jgi:hypothetical protein
MACASTAPSGGGTDTGDTDSTDQGDGGGGTDGGSTECAEISGEMGAITFQTSVELSGVAQTHGAMAATDEAVYACSGNKVVSFDPCMANTPTETTLGGACNAIAASSARVVVSSDDGQWQDLSGAKTIGPSARTLRMNETHIFGALGVDGVAVAPVDLSAGATNYSIGSDVRDTLPIAGGLAVADGIHGLKWMTLENGVPSPSAGGDLVVTGAVMALTPISDTQFVAALTGNGIVVVNAGPNGLTGAGELDTPGLASAVAVNADGYGLVADWSHVRLIDMRDPAKMTIIGREPFEVGKVGGAAASGQFGRALGVASAGGTWLVQSLNAISRVDIDTEVKTPELTLDITSVQITVLPGASGTTGVLFPNTGLGALEINNLKVGSQRITINENEIFGSREKEGVEIYVEPEDTGFISLTAEGTESLDTSLTFTTNDPDNPSVSIPMSINPTRLKPGSPAPDFIAPAVDGQMLQMAQLQGKVVYMKLFNGL